MSWLVVATAFVSAALAFAVEPLVAKLLLPTFGGSAAVWTTSLVFFQAALLAGYAWAHLTLRWLGVRRHAVVQVVLAALPLVVLPVALPGGTAPPAGIPTALWLFGLLAIIVGLPFVVLSTSGPTMQRWFASLAVRGRTQPYRLYAASNAGSLLGLLAYPVLIEPNLDLAEQARWWSLGFAAFVVLTAGAAIAVRRSGRDDTSAPAPAGDGGPAPTPGKPAPGDSAPGDQASGEPAPGARSRLRWVVLAALPAALLVGTTGHLSTDVAAVPLLWVVPLAIYLLTLVLAYARTAPIGMALADRLLPAGIALVAITLVGITARPVELVFAIHLATLGLAGLVLHGALAIDRPAPVRLTEYTLLVALGGALGGLGAAVIGPVVLPIPLELELALVGVLLVRSARREADRLRLGPLTAADGAGVLLVAIVALQLPAAIEGWRALATAGVAATVLVGSRPRLFAPLAAAALAVGIVVQPAAILIERTFYGTYRVVETAPGRHVLYAGTTIHGMQDAAPGEADEPRSYYHRGGPLGQVITALQRDPRPLRIGAVGLGVGTIAAYGRPGDSFQFFEIDPAVEAIARDPALFTYLADTPAAVEVVIVDGRLGLESVAPAAYDLLVLDAFSSDAVPVHLLTVEALRLSMDRMAPGGVVAIHVSNRYLDLEAVVAAGARELGLIAITGSDLPAPTDTGRVDASRWVIMARAYSEVADLATGPDWRTAQDHGRRPWTDRASDLLSVLGGQ
ncbi:MAG: fused MFS/spermidine synthase [Chloroflexota bacterium]